ncbi:TetR/AcrR family transcriptional regulator [Microbacterium sp. NPDC055910]|uniref:TetR/AcrR family transcriptional regulator n=1 Tax=Microbacterium sp. NPDC055910 TaxID=3345659 RepID=UPI0035DB3EEA
MASVPATEQATPARRGRPGYSRERILAVAVDLFNERGYDATSVADLASRLGVTKSALYHHFASREELLEVAVDDALTGLETLLDAPGATSGTPIDRLRFVLHGAVLVLVERLPSVTLLLRVRGNSDVERRALDRRRTFDHRVTALVTAAQRAGEVRSDVDGAVATRLMFGMVNSVTEWYRPGGGLDADTLATDTLRVALDGLGIRNVSNA